MELWLVALPGNKSNMEPGHKDEHNMKRHASLAVYYRSYQKLSCWLEKVGESYM